MKKILITTGGTGGHVIPAKIIEEHLKNNFKIYYSTDIRGLKYISSGINKTIIIDSDKSISIRSFLIAAISQNISVARNILESDDVFSTINCLKKLGVKIKKLKSKHYLIYGKGLGSLNSKKMQNLILEIQVL